MYQTDLRHPLRPLPPPVPAHELTAAQRAEAAEEKAVAYRENVEGDGHPARRVCTNLLHSSIQLCLGGLLGCSSETAEVVSKELTHQV